MSSPFFGLFGTQFHVFKVNNDVPFFRTSKQRFACMTEKSTNDDNDDCNDIYDSNDGNFDDSDDKNYQKTYKY